MYKKNNPFFAFVLITILLLSSFYTHAQDLLPLPLDIGEAEEDSSDKTGSGSFVSQSDLFRESFEVERTNFLIVVIKNRVNVRSGPGPQYPVIDKARKGDEFLARKNEDMWVRVALPDIVGWMSDKYLRMEPAGSDGVLRGTVTGRGVNIRKGPSTSQARISRVSKGNKLLILDKAPGWYKIKIPIRREGFIFNEMVVDKERALRQICVDGANLRDKPGKYYKLLGSLSRGALVYSIETSDDWTLILDEKNRLGWMMSSFMEVPPPTATINDGRLEKIHELKGKGDLSGLIEACEQYLHESPAAAATPKVRYELALALSSAGEYASALKELDLVFKDRIFFEEQDKAERLKSDIMSGPMNGVEIQSLNILTSGISPDNSVPTPEILVASFTSRWGHVERFTLKDNKYESTGKTTDIMDQEFVSIGRIAEGRHILATNLGLYQIISNADNREMKLVNIRLPVNAHDILDMSIIPNVDGDEISIALLYEDSLLDSFLSIMKWNGNSEPELQGNIALNFKPGKIAPGFLAGRESILVEQILENRHSGIMKTFNPAMTNLVSGKDIHMQLRTDRIIDMILADPSGGRKGMLCTVSLSGSVRELRFFDATEGSGSFIRGMPLATVSIAIEAGKEGSPPSLYAVSSRGDLYIFKRF